MQGDPEDCHVKKLTLVKSPGPTARFEHATNRLGHDRVDSNHVEL